MSSERLKFISSLKANAFKEQPKSVPLVTRPSVSPVPFSDNFTKEDLRRLGEMIEIDSDEEPAQSSISNFTCGEPVCCYDPPLGAVAVASQSPLLVPHQPDDRNAVSILESPNLSPFIAQQIAELEFAASPAPATPSSLSELSMNQLQRTKRQSTTRKDVGRSRKVHTAQWADVRRKENKNLGKQYISRDGKIRKKKELGPTCGEKCKLKCAEKISEKSLLKSRELLFASFWSMGEIIRHWEYVNRFCEKIPKRRKTTELESRREFTIRYYLPANTETQDSIEASPNNDSSKIQVCKTMFLNTLGNKQGLVYSSLNKLTMQGTIAEDLRGQHKKHKKVITEEIIESVCSHVNSFVPVESHYVRTRSKKLYLDGSLTFARMFLLYKDWEDPKNLAKAKTLRQYRDIINEKINLGFNVPKKDQCDVCHVYTNLPKPTSEDETLTFNTHIRNKTIARELKNKDKEISIKKNYVITAVHDFQKVHGMPCGETSSLYYKRKLSVFNFTIFEMGNKIAKCYVWDESTAKRGAIEVSSCLYDFIRDNSQNGKKVFNFWSDNCGGQNRNRIVFATYLRAAKDFGVAITHKYFEKGHTQNEGDSVHALIERTAKNKMVYTPEQWYALIRWAKQNKNPYIVNEMATPNFIDFKALIPGCNWVQNTDKERVFWSQLKQLEIYPESCDRIQYKTDFCQHDFKCIIVNHNAQDTPKTRNRNRLRLVNSPLPIHSRTLTPAYTGRLPIPKAKIQDLHYLCRNNIIPSIYHDFFFSLPEGDVYDHDEEEE